MYLCHALSTAAPVDALCIITHDSDQPSPLLEQLDNLDLHFTRIQMCVCVMGRAHEDTNERACVHVCVFMPVCECA